MESHGAPDSGYWYRPDDSLDPPAAILQALRDYRTSEVATRRSTRDSMGMGETDLLALRYLLRAKSTGERVGPKDLSRVLGITTASTTSLIDRLVGRGHVRREPNPTRAGTSAVGDATGSRLVAMPGSPESGSRGNDTTSPDRSWATCSHPSRT